MINNEELSKKILKLTLVNSDYIVNVEKILKVNLDEIEQKEDIFGMKRSNIKLYHSKGFDSSSLVSLIEVTLRMEEGKEVGIIVLSLIEESNVYVEDIIDPFSITEIDLAVIPEIDSCLITYPINANNVTFYQKINDNYKLTKILIKLSK